jgi:hypothetical protein
LAPIRQSQWGVNYQAALAIFMTCGSLCEGSGERLVALPLSAPSAVVTPSREICPQFRATPEQRKATIRKLQRRLLRDPNLSTCEAKMERG